MNSVSTLCTSPRVRIAVVLQVIVLVLVSGMVVAPQASANNVVRTLFLSGRFNPVSAPVSQPLATQMLAQPGETEGFQVATLLPVVEGDPAPLLRARLAITGNAVDDAWLASHASLFRVGFVKVTRPTSMVGRIGVYADPLPPLGPAGFPVSAGAWAGVVISISVPLDAPAAEYTGAIELLAGAANAPYVSVPFTIRVSSVAAINPASGNAFHALVGVRPTYYRAAAPTTDTATQFQNLFAFLSEHKVTPLDWTYSKPNRLGSYTAGAAGMLQGYHQKPFATKMVPNTTTRFRMRDNFATYGKNFLTAIWSYWGVKGWTGVPAYLYAWDEPATVDEHSQLPALMRMLHETTPEIKGFVTTTPRQRIPPRRFCRKWHTPKCFVVKGSPYSNRNLWNGGSDDPDVFVVAAQRFYGLVTHRLERRLHIDHTLDVWKRIKKIRRQNKQVWSYTYFMPTRHIPQLVIDGSPSDPRVLFWWNAMAKNTGWLTWEIARWINPRHSSASGISRDPYRETLSYITPRGAEANGDTSLIYPPISPTYGLTDPSAKPVSSLRFETLRDGVEDANLLIQYRLRFGDAALNKLMSNVFGKVRRARDGNYTWPTYTQRGMGIKLEVLRREVILQLEIL